MTTREREMKALLTRIADPMTEDWDDLEPYDGLHRRSVRDEARVLLARERS